MRGVGILAICLMAGNGGAADDLGQIDYDLLFEQNADQVRLVEQADGRVMETLDLAPDIHVRRVIGEYSLGIDYGPDLAVGCGWMILQEIALLDRGCPDALSPAEREMLAGLMNDVGGFVARNTVPPVPEERFLAAWGQLIRNRPLAEGGDFCETAERAGIPELAHFFLSDDGRQEILQMISVPRLPVSNPCL